MDKTDFLPEQIKVQRARWRRLFRQANLLLTCVAVAVALGVVRQDRISKAQAELTQLTQRVTDVHVQLSLRNELERQLSNLTVQKRIVENLGSRAGALDVMASLDALVPESIVLTSLNLETMEVRLPTHAAGEVSGGARATVVAPAAGEMVENRVRLVITGMVPTDVDLANFIGQLSACPLFEDVNMGYAKNVEFRGRPARQFLVSCYVVR